MSFLADFHIHSHFSIATSKECDPEHLFLWSCLKGVRVVGTGDFTHPGWLGELSQKLIPAEEGLFRLRPEYEAPVLDEIPKSCHQDVRFIFSAEISSIYKKGGKTRKVHNCLLVPTLEEAGAISKRLERIGNIKADGRPILGLDSRNLLEIMLEESPKGIFIPAHIWTPHFSLFGAYSGFDTLEECFEDLSGHIWALETGLSSDPIMNWRVSSLDRYTLVSNSDAHSPKNLAREANILECDLSFPAIRSAIKDKDKGQFLGTSEFFPQEGKYHYNGHRNCGVRLTPEETIKINGICPQCGKQLTLGVMHRVVELADRPSGFIPHGAAPFTSLIPLPEILSDYFEVGKNSKRVYQSYFNLIQKIGPEWGILTRVPIEKIKQYAGPALAEGIHRIRKGDVTIRPGFDGEYGTISIFSPKDRMGKKLQISLFAKKEGPQKGTICVQSASTTDSPKEFVDSGLDPVASHPSKPKKDRVTELTTKTVSEQLNPEQLEAAQALPGPVLVIAGPGTGKTRTLAYRISYLINRAGVKPDEIMAITFTNKAAKEMKLRLGSIMTPSASFIGTHHPVISNDNKYPETGTIPSTPFIGTFHQFCLNILKRYGPDPNFMLFHTYDSLGLIDIILKNREQRPSKKPRDCLQEISLLKVKHSDEHCVDKPDPFVWALYEEYQQALMTYNAYDYDDLLVKTVELLKGNGAVISKLRAKYRHILIDEFQDVNAIQYSLVKLLAAKNGEGLFVIGDPNQSIYGFRGADESLFFRLREEFPGAQTHTLESNYRTSIPILNSALSVIAHNPQPAALRLKSVRGPGPCIQTLELPSEKTEGIAIVKQITALMGGIDMLQAHGESGKISQNTRDGYSFCDFAILFRTANQADILEECLLREGIPYQLVGHQGILENPVIRQILALLRWSHHPQDRHSLQQALNLSIFSKIKKKNAQVFHYLIDTTSKKPGNLIGPASNHDPEIHSQIQSLARYQKLAAETSPSEFIDLVISHIKQNAPAKGNQRDLQRLSLLAEEFADISSFLENVYLYREGDISWKGSKKDKGQEMVSLMTLHAAKGLEFPVVFICGCEDGLLPYQHNENAANNINEERRLFYVGMTRARDRLYLSWSKNRTRYGKRQTTQLSPFCAEIPPTYYEKTTFTPSASPKPKNRQLSLW